MKRFFFIQSLLWITAISVADNQKEEDKANRVMQSEKKQIVDTLKNATSHKLGNRKVSTINK